LSFLDDFFLGGNKAKEGRKEGRAFAAAAS
jgi:hypothetical protein